MRKKGFTLIELVMIIIILGILAVVAIPRYFELSDQAKAAAEDGVVGGVRGGIHTYFPAGAIAEFIQCILIHKSNYNGLFLDPKLQPY